MTSYWLLDSLQTVRVILDWIQTIMSWLLDLVLLVHLQILLSHYRWIWRINRCNRHLETQTRYCFHKWASFRCLRILYSHPLWCAAWCNFYSFGSMARLDWLFGNPASSFCTQWACESHNSAITLNDRWNWPSRFTLNHVLRAIHARSSQHLHQWSIV